MNKEDISKVRKYQLSFGIQQMLNCNEKRNETQMSKYIKKNTPGVSVTTQ